jgi:hypothetical protein
MKMNMKKYLENNKDAIYAAAQQLAGMDDLESTTAFPELDEALARAGYPRDDQRTFEELDRAITSLRVVTAQIKKAKSKTAVDAALLALTDTLGAVGPLFKAEHAGRATAGAR